MPKINPLRPRQNGLHCTDDTLNRMFLNENVRTSIKISLKFPPKGPINNISALVQIMVWHQPGNKPLSEPMMVSLLMHICVTRPQWVNKDTGTLNLVAWFQCICDRYNNHHCLPIAYLMIKNTPKNICMTLVLLSFVVYNWHISFHIRQGYFTAIGVII